VHRPDGNALSPDSTQLQYQPGFKRMLQQEMSANIFNKGSIGLYSILVEEFPMLDSIEPHGVFLHLLCLYCHSLGHVVATFVDSQPRATGPESMYTKV
jgi:hypothetical protein